MLKWTQRKSIHREVDCAHSYDSRREPVLFFVDTFQLREGNTILQSISTQAILANLINLNFLWIQQQW